jgi:erythromycin esterase-like protein
MAGFYGLDLYNLGGSMRAVIDFLDGGSRGGEVARERYGCLMPWSRDPAAYGRLALSEGYARCEAGRSQMLKDLLQRRSTASARNATNGSTPPPMPGSSRMPRLLPRHVLRLGRELESARHAHVRDAVPAARRQGPETKAIVWAHNSHIGNAAFTEMGMGARGAQHRPAGQGEGSARRRG